MSSYSTFRKRVLEYSPIMKTSYHSFLKENDDIMIFCESLLKKMPHVFSSANEVFKTVFYNLKIPKCKICKKRLNYKAYIQLKAGKTIHTCSKECRKKYVPITIQTRGETLLKKYGVFNISSSPQIKELKKQKALEKYGVENVAQSKIVKDKMQKTCLKRYGVKYSAQSDKVRTAVKLTAKNRTPEEKAKVGTNIKTAAKKYFLPILIERFKRHNLEFINPEEYEGYNNFYHKTNKGYSFRCLICGTEFQRLLHTGHDPRYWCPTCNKSSVSQPEKELASWIGKYFSINCNNRQIIAPQELDIFIPDKNIAIEFDGLYYHSSKPSRYHLEKTLKCEEKQINLIHIFEDEWHFKKRQVKSLIKDIVGFGKTKLASNNIEIKCVDKKIAEIFLNKYSFSGFKPSKQFVGVYHKNRLIFVCSFAKPKAIKDYEWELNNFASMFNFSIDKALEKCIDFFKEKYSNSIIYYKDRRFPLSIDGKPIKETKPIFYYVKGRYRFSRLDFTKDKQQEIFENFDNNLSEQQNMFNNGYSLIYDCGKLIYKL